MIKEVVQVASNITDSLRPQPLAMALIVVNLIFLLGGGWLLHDISTKVTEGQIRRDKMLFDVMMGCYALDKDKDDSKKGGGP